MRRHHRHHSTFGGWLLVALVWSAIIAGWVGMLTHTTALLGPVFFAVFGGILWLVLRPRTRRR